MSQKQNLKTAIEQAAKELNVEVPQFTDKTTVKELEVILEKLESKLPADISDNSETGDSLDEPSDNSETGDSLDEPSDNSETDASLNELSDESDSKLDELAPLVDNEMSLAVKALLTFEYTNFDGESGRLLKNQTNDIPIKEAEAAIRAGVAVEV